MAITPSDIRNVEFKRSPLGRRGYEENAVDDFLDEVANDFAQLIDTNHRLIEVTERNGGGGLAAENAQLAARVKELEQQLAGRGDEHTTNAEFTAVRRELAAAKREVEQLREESKKDLMGISTRAVNLLSEAQASADTTIDEAEQYARDLVMTARDQYREILNRAEQTAAQITKGQPSRDEHPGGYTKPVPEIEYVRTYVQIAHGQLRSILDTLSTEVDKLGSLPRFAPDPSTKPPAPPAKTPASPDGTPAAPMRSTAPQVNTPNPPAKVPDPSRRKDGAPPRHRRSEPGSGTISSNNNNRHRGGPGQPPPAYRS